MTDYQDPLTRLGDEESLEPLAQRIVDLLLEQPLRRFLSPETLLGHLLAACDAPLWERSLSLHASAFCQRDQERAKLRGDKLGDYLNEETKLLLRRELGEPLLLDRAFLEALVRQEAVKSILRSMVEETLQRFAQALKPGGPNGLLGGLSKGPAVALLQRMAGQIEAQIQRAAASFVSQSLEVLLGRLVHILATQETAAQLGRLRLAGFEALLELPTRSAWSLARKLPIREVLSLAPALVRHNLGREEIQAAALAEAEAFLAEEGSRSLGDLLGEKGRAHLRETARKLLPSYLKDLGAAEGVGARAARPLT
ncbi:MAG: hypothetical protein RBU30_20705 [Polyangia bacterium]|nr:hypothetical protein [Polyangia bacterium]